MLILGMRWTLLPLVRCLRPTQEDDKCHFFYRQSFLQFQPVCLLILFLIIKKVWKKIYWPWITIGKAIEKCIFLGFYFLTNQLLKGFQAEFCNKAKQSEKDLFAPFYFFKDLIFEFLLLENYIWSKINIFCLSLQNLLVSSLKNNIGWNTSWGKILKTVFLNNKLPVFLINPQNDMTKKQFELQRNKKSNF